jgi:hypothetical protein
MENNVHENRKYFTGCKKTDKIRHDNTKHYPNRDEASLLRKIMTETGLCEEEVRLVKKYRIMLSEAQKQGQERKRSRETKWAQNHIKSACRITGLAPQHPETLKVLDKMLQSSYGLGHYPCSMYQMNAKTLVNNYSK